MDLETMIVSAGPSGHNFGGTAKGRAYCKQNNFKMLLDFWVNVVNIQKLTERALQEHYETEPW